VQFPHRLSAKTLRHYYRKYPVFGTPLKKELAIHFKEINTKDIIGLSHVEDTLKQHIADKSIICYEHAFSLKEFCGWRSFPVHDHVAKGGVYADESGEQVVIIQNFGLPCEESP
jgi:hypothetical protein